MLHRDEALSLERGFCKEEDLGWAVAPMGSHGHPPEAQQEQGLLHGRCVGNRLGRHGGCPSRVPSFHGDRPHVGPQKHFPNGTSRRAESSGMETTTQTPRGILLAIGFFWGGGTTLSVQISALFLLGAKYAAAPGAMSSNQSSLPPEAGDGSSKRVPGRRDRHCHSRRLHRPCGES